MDTQFWKTHCIPAVCLVEEKAPMLLWRLVQWVNPTQKGPVITVLFLYRILYDWTFWVGLIHWTCLHSSNKMTDLWNTIILHVAHMYFNPNFRNVALRLFSSRYGGALVVESNSSNVIAWVSNRKSNPWNFQFHFNEIRELSATLNVSFCHEVRSTNSTADVLAKQGVKRLYPWVGVVI